MPLPPLASLLDPRLSEDAAKLPIANSVNIPLVEIPSRLHELPSKHSPVRVADVDRMGEAACRLLQTLGRTAVLTGEWVFGPTGPARLWSPNPFLLQVVAELSPGSAIDLACGSGRDAVALAGFGWSVAAFDHLPDALRLGQSLADRYLAPIEAAKIEWIAADLENSNTALTGQHELTTMFWYLNRPLIRSAIDILPPGGSLVLETFTVTHRKRFGKPRTESFVLGDGELLSLASSLQVRIYEEGWHDGRHSARLWATRES